MPLVACATEPGAKIRNIRLHDCKIRAENSIVLAGISGSIDGVELELLSIRLDYGKARPLFGSCWDLSPHPPLASPDPKMSIPWLWAEGATHLKTDRITIEKSGPFTTDAMVKYD